MTTDRGIADGRIGSPSLVIPVAIPALASTALAFVLALLLGTAPLAAAEAGAELGPEAGPSEPLDEKAVAITSRLLLPYYEVDANNPAGDSTLYAVRNEGVVTISITASYYEIDSPQAPQRTEVFLLGSKQTKTVNIRDVPNLEVDGDGHARGYVIFDTGTQSHLIHGDFFQLTPGQAFATGARMVDISNASPYNELCSNMSIRFLSGGGFTGGTQFVFWLDSESLPLDPSAITYSVYTEAGGEPVFTNNLPVDTVAGSVDVEQLLGPFDVDFGAVEFQLGSGLLGTIAAVMSASNQFSVRVEATCRD